MIGGLMVTLLLANACQSRRSIPRRSAPRRSSRARSPRRSRRIDRASGDAGACVFWWMHALLILAFLNYLPYSKHLHVVTSLINVYLSNTSGPGQKGVMRPMDLEADVEQFGASDVEHLTWKNLLDGYSCTECGRCTAACPANLTGKLLSPRKIVVNTRQRLMEKGAARDRRPDGVLASAPRARRRWRRRRDDRDRRCSTIGCSTPTSPKRSSGRARAVARACRSVRCRSTSSTSSTRCAATWCSRSRASRKRSSRRSSRSSATARRGRSVRATARSGPRGSTSPRWPRSLERGERPDVLFWVGCMGSFDDRAKKITVAFARILKACDINFAILGQEEHCHGDPARRMGNEYLYQMLAKDTIGTLDRYEVKTIVTSCPHCFHQMGNEFPQLGGNYEVIHHSTYIERLLQESRVPLNDRRGQAAHRRVPRLVLPRPLQRRLRRAARDAAARAAGHRARRAEAHEGSRAVLRRRRRTHVHGGARRASASTSSAPRSCSRPAPTRSPSRARSA